MKKKLAVVLATLLVLSGCGREEGSEQSSSNDRLSEQTITLSDGRVITCVVYRASSKGGLSCDWEGGK